MKILIFISVIATASTFTPQQQLELKGNILNHPNFFCIHRSFLKSNFPNIFVRRGYQIQHNFIKKCWGATNNSSDLFKWYHRSFRFDSLQNVETFTRRMQLLGKAEKWFLVQCCCYWLPEWAWRFYGDSFDFQPQRKYLLCCWFLWKCSSSAHSKRTRR